MSTRTRFEKEAKGNSEMAYLSTIKLSDIEKTAKIINIEIDLSVSVCVIQLLTLAVLCSKTSPWFQNQFSLTSNRLSLPTTIVN